MAEEKKDWKTQKYDVWTKTEDECYDRNCNCESCPVSELLNGRKCHVKEAIREHIKKRGMPEHLQGRKGALRETDN